jgi:predicted  nucleic acid-binding Zn-ribbon protein
MEPQILVNILLEISELEDLLLEASQTLSRNSDLTFTLDELQEEYEADAAEAARKNEGTEITVRGLEKEIRQVEELLKVKRELAVGLTDRRQSRAVHDEIRTLENRLDRLEDQTINLLDKQELIKTEAEDSRNESRAHGAKSKTKQEAMAADNTVLSQRTLHINRELERLVSMLPPSESRAVIRLREKLDQAVVHHHEGACQGCFNQLPQQQAIQVDLGRAVVRCPSCMRFLVHRSWR